MHKSAGGSLESIAMNKAGVFKSKRSVIVSGHQHGAVEAILREQASSLDCDYISVEETVSVETMHTELQNSGMQQEIEISMKGSWEGATRMWSSRMKTGMLVSSEFPPKHLMLIWTGIKARKLCVYTHWP